MSGDFGRTALAPFQGSKKTQSFFDTIPQFFALFLKLRQIFSRQRFVPLECSDLFPQFLILGPQTFVFPAYCFKLLYQPEDFILEMAEAFKTCKFPLRFNFIHMDLSSAP